MRNRHLSVSRHVASANLRYFLLAAAVIAGLTLHVRAAQPGAAPVPQHPPIAAKAGDQLAAPRSDDDAALQAMGKKLGQKLSITGPSRHIGVAQDVDENIWVIDVKAEPVGGESPGAKLKMDVRVTETLLQGGDSTDTDYAIDIDLRRDGDGWICVKAIATPGMVSTKFGPQVGGAPQPPITITAGVQRALVAIGAAEPAADKFHAAIVKWVSENNAFGADSKIAQDMGQIADKSLATGANFGILLGPGLMKSGKATRVGVFCGQMYTVEYTDERAKQAGLKDNTVVHSHDQAAVLRRIPPDAELEKPDFGAAPLSLSAGIKGTVSVRASRRLPQSDYVIRLSYSIGSQNVSAYHHLGQWLVEKEKPVDVKFGPPSGADAAKFSGPLVVFVDVCEMTPDGNGGNMVEVISRSTAMVVDVKGGAEGK